MSTPINNEVKINPELAHWFRKKIKGGLAEVACRAHFEALGYAVESTGIERIAPQYCALNHVTPSSYMKQVKEIQNLPDFLISRQHNLGKDGAPKADGMLVETKYRTQVVFKDFTEEMISSYSNLIERGIPFIVYLVCKRHDLINNENETCGDGFVFLNYFNQKDSRAKGGTGWKEAGANQKLLDYPLYRGMPDGPDFNQAYQEIVHPILSEMLGN